jgi:hypothetical protein
MSKQNDLSKDTDHIDCENMTNAEIEDWIVTTRKVLVVLDGEDKNIYNKLYQDFILDLQNLKDAGRITDIDYEEILESL